MTAQITRVSPADTARSFSVNHYREAYARGISVSQLLERDDPTAEYAADDRDLDAFERVMREANLITNPVSSQGILASTWGDATNTREKRAMMHEFAARIWRQATRIAPETATTRALLLSGDAGVNTLVNPYTDDMVPRAPRLVPPIPLDAIVARTSTIDTEGYRSLYIVDTLNQDSYRLKRVSEGADIPATNLVTGEHTLQIQKFGRALRASYEQLRRQRLDRIAFILKRMALQAEVDKVSLALTTIINGDGNSNTAATVIALTALDAAAAAGTLTLKGWLTFKARFTSAYNPNTLLAQEASAMQLALLPVNTVNGTPLILMPGNGLGDLRNVGAPFNQGTLYGITSDAPALKLVTFDSAQTLERVVEIGGNVSEVERFILNQTQILTLTEVEGFGILDANGSKI